MSQDLADLGQWSALTQHLDGHGVTQAMGANWSQTGANECLPDNSAHAVGTQLVVWSTESQEDLARAAWRTARVQYPTNASPTSTGIGNRSSRRPLPRMTISPPLQSMSVSFRAPTSTARKPSRTSRVRTA